MIAIIRETIIWNMPEEQNELKEYLKQNPEVEVNVTTEKTITSNNMFIYAKRRGENE